MPSLSRRRLLAGLGAGVVALAGCTAPGSTNGRTSDGTDDGTSDDPAFEGCPAVRANVDETVCAATAGDAPVVLRPSATRVESPGTLRFVLANGGDATLGLNPYDWAVHRRGDDGWAKVAPDAVVQPWFEVPPGESMTWELQVGAANATPEDVRVAGPLDLDSGVYAFSVVAARDESTRTAYVARFRVA